jgi:hypothetical protein
MASLHSLRVAAGQRPGSWFGRPTARRVSATWLPSRLRAGVGSAGAAAASDARTRSRWATDTASRRGCVLVESRGRRVDPESAGVEG